MFLNKSMTEGNTGEIKIDDFDAEDIETMIEFIYNDQIQEKKKITPDLLRAAEKYNLAHLVNFCVEHLMSSLSLDSVLDVLVVAHLTNQKKLLDAATDFFKKNQGKVVKTNNWKQFEETNTGLIADVFSKMFDLQ